MSASCVLVSNSIHIVIGGDELDRFASGLSLVLPFSLKGQVLTDDEVVIYLTGYGQEDLARLRRVEKEARVKAHLQLPEWQPGYSNRKIRKGKGHGKG